MIIGGMDGKQNRILIIDDELMGMDQLRRIANMAGKAEGLGTWRPRYGRFAVTNIKEVDQ